MAIADGLASAQEWTAQPVDASGRTSSKFSVQSLFILGSEPDIDESVRGMLIIRGRDRRRIIN
jgi:hypothetical protein